ncbi:MAG TPA: hypothetical protein VND91_01055, partial [Candidatus Saccharimonadia bacterium]|nr:hypothetical protein [Candidatus Saccharimonadia bacterium]
IETLIEDQRMSHPSWNLAVRIGAGAALLVALGLLPAVRFAAIAAERTHHVSIINANGTEKFSMKNSDLGLDVEIDGKVEFTAAEDDVASLEDEAKIEQETGGVSRRIEYRNRGGRIEKRYFVEDDERPLDAAGRAWLAQVIPVLLREGGFDAEGRVARILARGGAGAVLDEVERIRGDHARRAYIVALAESTKLAPAELDRAIVLAAKSASDFERRSSLVALIDTQSPRAPQQVAILRAVADIGSDFEQRTVMQSLAGKLDPSDAVSEAWGAALATIESDFEARTVLQTFAGRKDLGADAVRLALRSSAGIGSDFERRSALESLAPHVARHPGLARDYAAAAAGIGSDFECRSALVALIEGTKPDVDASTAILAAVAEMGSDFEQRTVLVALAERMPADVELIRRYREVARGLGDFERGQAEKALDRFES